ncbi:MAG TPA: hypothetical protein VNT22_09580 [Baekduia sp.]|nr:hypothetical protein [Baekduia sp.]
MRRLLLVAVIVAAVIPVGVAFAVAPDATTNPATNVTTVSARLNGTVDPNGTPTSAHFEYGTTTAYGSSTPPLALGDGTSPLGHTRNVTGLVAGTTYHYRVVAVGDGTVSGADRTFVASAAPTVATGTATAISRTSATLRATVDANGLPTNYRFQYGTAATNLNRSTPLTAAGAGNSAIAVAANVAGLASNDRIYFRVTATNSSGTRTGSTRSFVTAKALRIASISIPRSRFGGSATITGDLDGTGVSGQTVVVQATAFPFSAPLTQVGSARADSRGNFAVVVNNIQANMRVRIVAAGNVSTVRNLFNGSRVGVKLKKARRLRFSGTVTPAAANGRVRIQKRKSNGRWGNVRRGKLAPFTNGRSRYSLSVRRRKGLYRVIVVPRDGGAHSAGYSRRLRVR